MNAPAGLPHVQEDVTSIADMAEAAASLGYDALLVRADFSDDGVVQMEGDLVRAEEVLPLNVVSDALDHFVHMRRLFQDAGQPMWTQAEVRVEPSGDASVHFTYPDEVG